MHVSAARQVEHMMQDMIWGDMNVHAVRGKHWDIHFYPVTNCPRMVGTLLLTVPQRVGINTGTYTFTLLPTVPEW